MEMTKITAHVWFLSIKKKVKYTYNKPYINIFVLTDQMLCVEHHTSHLLRNRPWDVQFMPLQDT